MAAYLYFVDILMTMMDLDLLQFIIMLCIALIRDLSSNTLGLPISY